MYVYNLHTLRRWSKRYWWERVGLKGEGGGWGWEQRGSKFSPWDQ